MTPESIMQDLNRRIRQSFGQGEGSPSRPMVRVRMVAKLDENVIDVDQDIPLGDTTPETIEHVQALACDIFMTLLHKLVESHYRIQQYRLTADLEEEASNVPADRGQPGR